MKVCSSLGRVWLMVAQWIIDRQVPLPVAFSKQEYWSGMHFLLQGIFLTQGSNPCLLYLLYWQVDSLPLVLPGTQTHKHRHAYMLTHYWNRGNRPQLFRAQILKPDSKVLGFAIVLAVWLQRQLVDFHLLIYQWQFLPIS